MSEIDGRLGREMALVSALLYGSGASLVVVTILVPHWDELAVAVLVGAAITAYIGACAHLAAARWWRPPPLLWFSLSAAFGTILIGVAVVAGGPEAASTYAILYVYVSAFAFYYFSLGLALGQVVFVAVSFGVALAVLGHGAAPAEWVAIVGASAGAGWIIGGLGQRARDRYVSEHRAAERLREADAVKSLLLQAASHEFRTPLTTLKGGAETLVRHDGDLPGPTRKELAERILANATRLERLVTDMLDAGSPGADGARLAVARVRLDELVRRVATGLDRDGRVEILAERAVVDADTAKLERVVESLVGNALKHTPQASGVRVTVSTVGDVAELVVEDEGPGIAEGDKERVFEPLYQGLRSAGLAQPGVGLGLALAARYVELHSGRIALEDGHGGGLRVRVVLPARAEAGTR